MLTVDEIVKCRHHMGYPNVSAVSTYALGVPAAMQTTFMIEGAVVRVLPEAEETLRRLLSQLDTVECKVDELLDIVFTSKAEDVEFDPKAIEKLAKVYKIRQQTLANLLAVVPNPFDQREWLQGAGGALNVPVTG